MPSTDTTLVLLPGMDGTGHLFARFQAVAGPRAQVIAWPADRVLDYDALVAFAWQRLPETPFALVAESFSGPVAVSLAARNPPGLVGLCLVASFVRNPTSFSVMLGHLLPAIRPPAWAVRRLLLQGEDDPGLLDDVMAAIRSVDARVMAARVALVLSVDRAADLARCPVPVTYLRATRDPLVGSKSEREVREVLPSARISVIEGCHLLLQTRPVASLAAIDAGL